MTGAHDMPTDHNINTTGDMTMSTYHDHEVDIRDYRDSLEADLGKWQETIDESGDDEAIEEAEANLDTFALEVSIQYRFEVLLSVGGPTVWLDAPVVGEPGDWERTGEITLHHSWGHGQKEIPVWNGSALAAYFDNALQIS